MTKDNSTLLSRIESDKPVLVVEIAPPDSGDASTIRAAIKPYVDQVHALSISDNRNGAGASALAAASIALTCNVEPILHMVTRDRNRIAIRSDCLGAEALGVRNLLITSGTHQTLGQAGEAKNVYDIDPIQALASAPISLCRGAAVSPFAEPIELHLIRIEKKVAAGADFFITDPVFDIEQFRAWWKEVTRRKIEQKAAFIVGIEPITSSSEALAISSKRPSPSIPEGFVDNVISKNSIEEQYAAGIDAAVKTISLLSGVKGLKGFAIRQGNDPAVVLEIIDKAGLRTI